MSIYDRNQQFTLYKVINLAKATDNETHGFKVGDLQEIQGEIKETNGLAVHAIEGKFGRNSLHY